MSAEDNHGKQAWKMLQSVHAVCKWGVVYIVHLKLTKQLFSCPVVSNSFRPHGLQHARPPCPSPSPEICPSSHPLCHSAISSSDTLFSFAFNLSQHQGLFQCANCTGAAASVLPTWIQGWFPLRLTGLISLLSNGLSGVFSSTTVWRHQFFGALPSLRSSSHNHTWLLGRPQPWLYGSLSAMSLLFNTLSRCVIAFLPRSNRLLISRLQSTSAVILEPKKRKSVTTSTFSPSICHEWGQMPRS